MIFKSERIGYRNKVSKVGERSQVFTKAYVMGGDLPWKLVWGEVLLSGCM